MIVNWTENRIKYAEIDGNQVTLLTGNNEVATEAWEAVRPSLQAELASGTIKEMNCVRTKNAEGVETLKITELQKIEVKDAIAIVANTYNTATLAKWRDLEGRDSVRAAINKQQEAVDKHGEQKTK